jgi:hypothetical protein
MSDFRVALGKPKVPGPETSPWYWNPNRVGATEAPAWFREKLKEVDPDGYIDVRWNPVDERWGVFYKKPNFNHKLSSGWMLLFPVKYPDGSYMPLDERVLARLYSASARAWGNGKQYFAAIEREFQRAEEKKDQRLREEAIDRAMPHFEHAQISVSAYGPSSGSKFSTYHSGL